MIGLMVPSAFAHHQNPPDVIIYAEYIGDTSCNENNTCVTPSSLVIQEGETVVYASTGASFNNFIVTEDGGFRTDQIAHEYDLPLVISCHTDGDNHSHCAEMTYDEVGVYYYYSTSRPWYTFTITVVDDPYKTSSEFLINKVKEEFMRPGMTVGYAHEPGESLVREEFGDDRYEKFKSLYEESTHEERVMETDFLIKFYTDLEKLHIKNLYNALELAENEILLIDMNIDERTDLVIEFRDYAKLYEIMVKHESGKRIKELNIAVRGAEQIKKLEEQRKLAQLEKEAEREEIKQEIESKLEPEPTLPFALQKLIPSNYAVTEEEYYSASTNQNMIWFVDADDVEYQLIAKRGQVDEDSISGYSEIVDITNAECFEGVLVSVFVVCDYDEYFLQVNTKHVHSPVQLMKSILANLEDDLEIEQKQSTPESIEIIPEPEPEPTASVYEPEPEAENICGEGTVYQNGKCVLDERGGGCLIATAAFGSEMAPQVQFLRELRDNTVLQTQSGTSFMTGFNQFYYSFSPTVADLERENPAFKETVKLALTPLLTSLTLLNYVDIDTESEMLGYGIGVILLNIGMYFIAPAVLIKRIFL